MWLAATAAHLLPWRDRNPPPRNAVPTRLRVADFRGDTHRIDPAPWPSRTLMAFVTGLHRTRHAGTAVTCGSLTYDGAVRTVPDLGYLCAVRRMLAGSGADGGRQIRSPWMREW